MCREVVLSAVRKDALTLEYAAPSLLADRDFVPPGELPHLGNAFTAKEREIVTTCLWRRRRPFLEQMTTSDYTGWWRASAALRRTRRLVEVLSAIQRSSGLALRFAAESVRADREVIRWRFEYRSSLCSGNRRVIDCR